MNTFSIQLGTLTFFSKKEFMHERIKYCTKNHFTGFFNANAHTTNGNAIGEIDSAINRVDNPFEFAIGFYLTRFFTKNKMIGKIILNGFEYYFLRCMIGFSYQVIDI